VDKEVWMTRPATRRRVSVLLGAITLAAAVAATLAPAAAAGQPACRVKNPTQDTWFATQDGRALTRAIAAANPGDRLNVFGTCGGNFVIDKDLRVFGNTQATAPTTLDGRGSGRVLTVLPSLRSSVSVRLTRLVVTGGGEGGIEVGEGTTVTLTSSTVRGNTATNRVGAGIANGGDLTLNSTIVTGNRAALDGGGVYNFGDLTLNSSRLTRNTSGGGGGGLFNEGTAVLNFSRVTGNTAAGPGGGILDVNTLILNSTVVSGNVPDDCAC
jgi:nitrous oxidase accessory protein NosD